MFLVSQLEIKLADAHHCMFLIELNVEFVLYSYNCRICGIVVLRSTYTT